MPFTATLEISEARKQLSSIEDRLKSDQVVYVTRHGKKSFAMVELGLLSQMLDTLKILKDPESLRMVQMVQVFQTLQGIKIPSVEPSKWSE